MNDVVKVEGVASSDAYARGLAAFESVRELVKRREDEMLARQLEFEETTAALQKDHDAKVSDLKQEIYRNTVEIEALHAKINALNDECRALLIERDEAIRERALLEGLFASVKVQIDAFELPAALPSIPRRSKRNGKTVVHAPPHSHVAVDTQALEQKLLTGPDA